MLLKRKSKFIWLYGIHAIKFAINNTKRKSYEIYATESVFQKNFLQIKHTIKIPISIQPKIFFEQKFPESNHQNCALKTSPLPLVPLDELLKKKSTKLLLLDTIQDPHNLGAIIRSACAFSIDGIILPRHNSTSINSPVVAKSACGALETTNITLINNLAQTINNLKKKDFFFIGLDERADQDISQISHFNKIGIIAGSEHEGLRTITKKNCDFFFKIPTSTHFTTLNLSNSIAITLYEINKKKI